MINYSDQALLRVIASEEEDVEVRNKAFTIFYNRYQTFVANSLWRVCGMMANDEEFCRALLSNTFLRVYNHRKPFVIDDQESNEDKKRHVEGWLLKIANREFWKLQSDGKFPPDEAIEAFEFMIQAESYEGSEPYGESIIREAYALLSPRDQHVIHTYWQYYSPGKGNQAKNLPDSVLSELATRYHVTSENIRQIISRGNKKIKEFLKRNYTESNRNNRTSHVR